MWPIPLITKSSTLSPSFSHESSIELATKQRGFGNLKETMYKNFIIREWCVGYPALESYNGWITDEWASSL